MSSEDMPTVVVPGAIGPGTRLNDIYEIDGLLATGGMGQIYRGHAIETGDPVAIKMIRTDFLANESALALFKREATALHQIHHEAIVRYFVFTVDRHLQRAYLAMEFVQGEPLGKVLQGGRLSVDDTLALMRRVAGGLRAAHEAGIVHRDISPDNIIIPQSDVKRARIIDFGIAKNSLMEGTVVGENFVGKYRYASPEQFGEFGGKVTGQSDIYSLGLVLAGCVLGKPLDMGQSIGEAIARRRSVPDLSAVDGRIRPLLEQMLQPDPARRPATMAQVAEWLPEGSGPKARRDRLPPGRRTGLAAAGTAAVLLAVLAPLALWRGWLPLSHAPQAPPPPAPVQFAQDYAGGSCFTLEVTKGGPDVLVVDAYGAEIAPFAGFDKAFTDRFHFDPQIDLRQVTVAQCPAITLLGALRSAVQGRPALSLNQQRLAQGETLTGSVTSSQPWTALLRVDEDGGVSLVGDQFGGTATRSFGAPVRRVKDPPGQPQLLVGLSTQLPLKTVAGLQGTQPADEVFPAIMKEAADSQVRLSGTLSYFKVQ